MDANARKADVRIDFSKFNSLFRVMEYFTTDAICKQTLAETRWPDGDVICPYCGGHHCKKGKDGRYLCRECNHKFNVTVGTIFENTKLSLRKWFLAMYLISSHKKGISSHQIGRDLDVTQKTAWFILHKLRSLYGQSDETALEGEVECDEMYLGGRETNKHENKKTEGTQGRSTKTKTPIFGMVQREGDLRAMKVADTKGSTLMPIIKQFVRENAHLFTDEHNGYNGLDAEDSKYGHSVIRHKEKQFSDGNGVTTNTIEGFWGHFKRMVFGIYHFVSAAYLQRYIDEAVFRWNTREAAESSRFQHMFRESVKIYTYKNVKKAA